MKNLLFISVIAILFASCNFKTPTAKCHLLSDNTDVVVNSIHLDGFNEGDTVFVELGHIAKSDWILPANPSFEKDTTFVYKDGGAAGEYPVDVRKAVIIKKL